MNILVCRVAVALAAVLVSFSAFSDDYKLRPGDTIELSIAGLPDMRQRYTLDLDGQISINLIGDLNATGLTARELRAKLQKVLSTKVLRFANTAQETLRAIEPDEIAVNVVEYRPVYLDGDVARPGDQRFRPDMTVRQVVALAGGYEVTRYRGTSPLIDGANFQAEYEMLWVDYARALLRLSSLQAELGTGPDLSQFSFPDLPVPDEVLTNLFANERKQLETRRADHDKEVAFLQHAVKSAGEQLAVLEDQEKKEKEGVESDTEQVNRLLQFNQRGTVTADRVVAERRSMLFASTRLLQTIAQTAQATRERDDLLRRLDRNDDARRLQLLQQIQDAQVNLAALRVRIRTVGDKLLYTSAVRSQMKHGWSPQIVLVRRDANGSQQIPATEDTVLQPGDTVEVTLTLDSATGSPVR
jgi:polysaccharide export outer membrane protein